MGPHLMMCIIFAFITLLNFSSDIYDHSFQLYYILTLCTILVICPIEGEWMNKNVSMYFMFILLFAIAERSAAKSFTDLSDTISPFINIAIFGLAFISFCNNQMWSTLLFTSLGIMDYLKKYVIFEIDDFSSFLDMFPTEFGPDLSFLQ